MNNTHYRHTSTGAVGSHWGEALSVPWAIPGSAKNRHAGFPQMNSSGWDTRTRPRDGGGTPKTLLIA